jgi:SAM-dependent methyltransferase
MPCFKGNRLRQERAARYAHGKILDVGCAGGDGFNPFLKGDITGFDIIDIVNDSANYKEIVKGDANSIKAYFGAEMFDTIIALELIEHLTNPIAFLAGCREILKPDGVLIISTPSPFYYRTIIGNLFFRKGIAPNENHYMLWSPRTLNRIAVDMGFEVLNVLSADRFYVPLLNWQMIYVYRKRGLAQEGKEGNADTKAISAISSAKESVPVFLCYPDHRLCELF